MNGRAAGRPRPTRSNPAWTRRIIRARRLPRGVGTVQRGAGCATRRGREGNVMASNRGVAYIKPGTVEVQDIDFPKLELRDGPGVHPANVGRNASTASSSRSSRPTSAGSDQHMVRGRTTAPTDLVLGQRDHRRGDRGGPRRRVHFGGRNLCSVPFNIACGRCRMCKEGHTGVCLNTNPDRPGAAYGYVDRVGGSGGRPSM